MARIRTYSPEEYQRAKLGFPQLTAFDAPAFKAAYAKAFALMDPVYLAATENMAASALVGFFQDKDGKNLIHPPFVPYQTLGLRYPALTRPGGDYTAAGELVVGHLFAYLGRYASWKANLPDTIADLRPLQLDKASEGSFRFRYTYIVSLLEDPALLRSPGVRKELRAASEQGFSMQQSTDIAAFRALHEPLAKDRGFFDAKAFDSLDALTADLLYQGLAELWLCHDAQNQAVAGRVVVLGEPGGTAYGWLSATIDSAQQQGAGLWFMAETLNVCRQKGFAAFDMCGANLDGVSRFKAKFGGRLVRSLFLHKQAVAGQSRWQRAVYHAKQALKSALGK